MYAYTHVILALDADGDTLVHLLVDPGDGRVLLAALQSTRIAQVFETADGVRVCAKIDVCLATIYIYKHIYIHTCAYTVNIYSRILTYAYREVKRDINRLQMIIFMYKVVVYSNIIYMRMYDST